MKKEGRDYWPDKMRANYAKVAIARIYSGEKSYSPDKNIVSQATPFSAYSASLWEKGLVN